MSKSPMPDPDPRIALVRESRTGGQAHWFCRTCGTFDGPMSSGRCDVCADAYNDTGDYIVLLVPKADAERWERSWKVAEDHCKTLIARQGRWRQALEEIAEDTLTPYGAVAREALEGPADA